MFTSPRDRLSTSVARRAFTCDSMFTYDAAALDSTGVFLIGELERLDQRVYEPLIAYTWSRDIDLRTDVTIADESSSFVNLAYAAAGINPTGKNWIGKDATSIPGISVDTGKTTNTLRLWGMELGWTVPELISAQRLGRPIDATKLLAMREKYQMDIDEQVYIGDTTLGVTGLCNSSAVTPANVAAGAGGSTWALKTADEIKKDVSDAISAAWAATGYKYPPSNLLIPPAQYTLITDKVVSSAGNRSVIEYIRMNNVYTGVTGKPLEIQPVKWLTGRGASSTDRMVAYTKNESVCRIPLTPLMNTPITYRSLYQLTTYFGRIGGVEFPYPEAFAYRDGI